MNMIVNINMVIDQIPTGDESGFLNNHNKERNSYKHFSSRSNVQSMAMVCWLLMTSSSYSHNHTLSCQAGIITLAPNLHQNHLLKHLSGYHH